MSRTALYLDRDKLSDNEPHEESGNSTSYLSPFSIPRAVTADSGSSAKTFAVTISYEGEEASRPFQSLDNDTPPVDVSVGHFTQKVMMIHVGCELKSEALRQVADRLERAAGLARTPGAVGRRLSYRMTASVLRELAKSMEPVESDMPF